MKKLLVATSLVLTVGVVSPFTLFSEASAEFAPSPTPIEFTPPPLPGKIPAPAPEPEPSNIEGDNVTIDGPTVEEVLYLDDEFNTAPEFLPVPTPY